MCEQLAQALKRKDHKVQREDSRVTRLKKALYYVGLIDFDTLLAEIVPTERCDPVWQQRMNPRIFWKTYFLRRGRIEEPAVEALAWVHEHVKAGLKNINEIISTVEQLIGGFDAYPGG